MAITTASDGKVLVTGAGGLIGRALVGRFAVAGVGYVAAVRALAHEDLLRPEFIALGDFAAADWTAALRGVSTVVHLAGRAHKMRDTAVDPDTAYVVANVHVTRRLVDAAARAGVRRIVLASSVKVYGESTPRGEPFRAGDAARPQDAYARSKAAAEEVLWSLCEAHAVEGVVLRLPLTYGPHVRGNFLALLDAVAAGRRLPLAGIDNRRSLLYVGNAVSAIEAACVHPALVGQTLPVADAEAVSTPELVERIARSLGVPARLYRVPAPLLHAGATLAGRRGDAARLTDSLEVDTSRFGELAGWSPPYVLDAGLAATAAWYRGARTYNQPLARTSLS